jgi:hypothetical protein
MIELKPYTQIDFKNGWTVHIHEIKDGCVYLQRFPPGVENQGLLQNLRKMPISEFEAQAKEAL